MGYWHSLTQPTTTLALASFWSCTREIRVCGRPLSQPCPFNYNVVQAVSDIHECLRHFRSSLNNRLAQTSREICYGPEADILRRSKTACYSITSSVIASNVGGIVMPSALAVLRSMMSLDALANSTNR
jgi:hypothetical protein